MRVVVVTNTSRRSDLNEIRNLIEPLIPSAGSHNGKWFEIVSFPDLENPLHLPWAHKPLIKTEFLSASKSWTHYINVEDDIELPFSGFLYFVKFRPLLRPYGLIPSFVRVEYNTKQNRLYSTDSTEPTRTHNRKIVYVSDVEFMNLENPHCAIIVLDQELASEYVETRSFDMNRSRDVHTWEICERSSMGLMWEQVPEGFYARAVVPLGAKTRELVPDCFVFHTSNNYTNNPDAVHGKVPIERVLLGEHD